jgi:hypothetical protein
LEHNPTSKGLISERCNISTRVIDETEWNSIDGAEKVYEVNGSPD